MSGIARHEKPNSELWEPVPGRFYEDACFSAGEDRIWSTLLVQIGNLQGWALWWLRRTLSLLLLLLLLSFSSYLLLPLLNIPSLIC